MLCLQYYTEETVYEEVPGEVRLGHVCMDCFSLEKSLFPLSYSGSQKDGEREAREAHLPARARKLVVKEQTMHLAS